MVAYILWYKYVGVATDASTLRCKILQPFIYKDRVLTDANSSQTSPFSCTYWICPTTLNKIIHLRKYSSYRQKPTI